MCCFKRTVPFRVRPARLVEPPVGQVWDVVRWPIRDSLRSPVPQQPQLLLRCEFIPALTGGFLLALLSLKQAWADERASPCSPVLTRGYLGPAGCAGTGGAAVGPHSGSGVPGLAGLSEPCDRPWHPQAGVGDTGRHLPTVAAPREVRGCPNLAFRARRYGAGGGPCEKPGRGHALDETTRCLSNNGPPTVLARTLMSSWQCDWPAGSGSAARPGFRCLQGRSGPP